MLYYLPWRPGKLIYFTCLGIKCYKAVIVRKSIKKKWYCSNTSSVKLHQCWRIVCCISMKLHFPIASCPGVSYACMFLHIALCVSAIKQSLPAYLLKVFRHGLFKHTLVTVRVYFLFCVIFRHVTFKVCQYFSCRNVLSNTPFIFLLFLICEAGYSSVKFQNFVIYLKYWTTV